MERLSNVSKVKSKLSGCSKDFCPCAGLITTSYHKLFRKKLVLKKVKLKSTNTYEQFR